MNRKIDRKKERKLARRVVPNKDDEPRWDYALPRTTEGIEVAMLEVSKQLLNVPPLEQKAQDEARKGKGRKGRLELSPLAGKLLKLQLFRCVFGREPNPGDPVFWDRSRESEGIFRMDRVDMIEAEAKVKVDPVKAQIAQLLHDLDKD
jgi:hypothetical protein